MSLLKKSDVTESRHGQNYFVTFFFTSARTGRWLREGKGVWMREGKGVHTIRDSWYHKEKGAEKTLGRDGSTHVKRQKNHQLQNFIPLGHISWVTVMYLHPEGGGERGGSNVSGAFLVHILNVTQNWWCTPVNSLSPDIKMLILLIVLHTFLYN